MFSGAGGTFDCEVVAVVGVVLQQRADDERIDGHPDRAAPVRVAAEHAGVGFARHIADAVILAADVEHIRMLGMISARGRGCRRG